MHEGKVKKETLVRKKKAKTQPQKKGRKEKNLKEKLI